MDDASFKYLFGPVPSRRLGRSLGVDTIPLKTCTYDCVYCQLGRTTNKTVVRDEYVPLEAVLDELSRALTTGPPPDYISFAGSGEPTLYSRLGELIAGIKAMTAIPVAVVTNGSLFWDPEVRKAVAEADLVMPSLDAGDEDTFQRVNRPHPDITFDKMVAGLKDLRREFGGPIWLEVFVLAGLTTERSQVEKIARIAKEIAPDRIQLNSVARPPAEGSAEAACPEELKVCAEILGGSAQVIHDYQFESSETRGPANEAAVVSLLKRRPCSVEDIVNGLGLHSNEVLKHLGHLSRDGRIERLEIGGRTCFSVVSTQTQAQNSQE